MFSKKLITSMGGLLIATSAVLAFPETPRRIEISAKKFSYSPNEITLKKGEPVVLVFHSEDGTHGFKLPEMNIKSDEIKKGNDSEVSFTPTQVGHFVGKCAHFCGKGHGSMTLQIDVVDWGPLPKNPEREFEVGGKISVNLHHGKIEDAVVRAVTQDADGIKLKVDVVGLDLTALMTLVRA